MNTLARIGLIAASLLGSSCGNGDIVISIQGISPETTSLRASVKLNGQPAPGEYEFNSQLDRFILRLPGDTSGSATLTINAYEKSGCRIASSTDIELPISGGKVVELSARLQPLMPKKCLVSIDIEGGNGKAFTQDGAIQCNSEDAKSVCSAEFDYGTQIRMSATAAGGYRFANWTGAGSDNLDLTVPVTQRQFVVANFAKLNCIGGVSSCIYSYGPRPQQDDLNAMWGSDSTDVWAVGVGGTTAHWDGSRWMLFDDEAVADDLYAMWGFKPAAGGMATDVWAGGDGGKIIRWNSASSTWKTEFADTNIGTIYGLWGISQSDMWAVTINGDTLRRDATGKWTSVANPAKPMTGSANRLFSVWGLASNDVWATGQNGIIIHWDGTKWSLSDSKLSTEAVRGIWGATANNIWAVGDSGSIIRWNGTAWSLNQKISQQFNAIYGTSASSIWAIGNQGTVYFFDGAAWNPLAKDPSVPSLELDGLYASSATDMWAVGVRGTILRYKR